MNVVRSIAAGLGRVARSPKLVLGLWLVNVLAALPATLVLSDVLESSIGPSLFHETMRNGFDADWFAEFSAENEGELALTFGPNILGAGAVYDNLEAWWSDGLFTELPLALLACGVAYALVWTLLLGGALGVLSRSGGWSAAPFRGLSGFLAAGSRTFGRFLQLTAAAGIVYFLIYRLARSLYGWIERSTGDVTSETAVFARVLAVVALVVVALHLVRMVFDYAKIAVFAEELSAPRALGRALGFVASHPASTLGVYVGFGVLALLPIVLYAAVAPGAGPSTFGGVLVAFLISQLYVVARIALRLSLLSGQLHLYRSPRAADGPGGRISSP